jgi:hypothetical protein
MKYGKRLLGVLGMALALMALAIPQAKAQAPFAQMDGLTGLPFTELLKFTNTASGVSSFQLTNTVIAITNGSLTVTSAPVALKNGGVSLWAAFAPTNALLTNLVSEFQFSPDGTNWSSDTLVWRGPGAAIAVGKYVAKTNVPRDVVGNMKFIRLWKVHVTNGVDNVGNIFLTNAQLPFVAQTFP